MLQVLLQNAEEIMNFGSIFILISERSIGVTLMTNGLKKFPPKMRNTKKINKL